MNMKRLITDKRRVVAVIGVSAIMVASVACSGADAEVSQTEVNNLVGTALSDYTQIASVEGSASAPNIVVSSNGGTTIEPSPPIRGELAVQSYGSTSIGNQQTGLWVDGLGSIDVEPDIATLSVGVESREPTVSAAREAAAEALQRVIDTVIAEGVLQDDIQTTSFYISPQTIYKEIRDPNGSYSQPVVVGYIVSNQLSVTIRDLDKVGDVVDAAADEAGDLVRINNINFGVDNPSQYGEELRRLAALDAEAKAQIYADTLGVLVGQLVYLSETGSSAPSVYTEGGNLAFASADGAFKSSTPIISGDTTLTARVQAVFAIAGS
ncbi:MAG: SIMPL domain-containing protein [Chloroflexi bacterium]|nr:SIMPL domain-containing protein [Chloroflexota bacterium]